MRAAFVAVSAIILMATVTTCKEDATIKEIDVTPPAIKLHRSSVLIVGAEEIVVGGNELRVGDNLVASWTDNVSRECTVKLEYNGKAIISGYTFTES